MQENHPRESGTRYMSCPVKFVYGKLGLKIKSKGMGVHKGIP